MKGFARSVSAVALAVGISLTAVEAPAATLAANTFDGVDLSGGNGNFLAGGRGDIGAEDFTLPIGATVESFSCQAITTIGADLSGSTVEWSLRPDVAALPGSTILASGTDAATTSLAGPATPSSRQRTDFTVDIPDTMLARATYWLTLRISTPNQGNSVFWKHTANGNNRTAISTDNGSTFSSAYSTFGANEVFATFGTESSAVVPLLAPALLLIAGLGGPAALRRRQQARSGMAAGRPHR